MSFRDLERGDQFIADYNKYKTWKGLDSEGRQSRYETLNVDRFTYAREDIYIAPFGFGGMTTYISARGPATGQSPPCPTLRSLLTGHFEANVPAGPTITVVSAGAYPIGRLAKLTLKFMQRRATAKSISRITGRKYFRHVTNSASMAFGKNTADDDFEAAVKKIKAKADYKTFNDVSGNAIIITSEKAA